MFSLFYGLPATYWKVFADVAQPPVLMDLFRQYGYQLGIFASSPVYSRVVGLDRTALARIPNLRLETISPYPGSRLVPHPTLPRDGLRAALREMSRFYK